MNNIIDLTLPEFAFVEGSWHEEGGDPLRNRIVVLHVRSASVIEIFDKDDVVLKDDILAYEFKYINRFGITETMVAALRYCMILDVKADGNMIIKEIMKPAAQWYCDYCTWEDKH